MAARVRETNRWDAVINGVNYRLARKEGAYRKVSGRSLLEVQQMLNQAGNQFTSSRDLRTLFQTNWSGGAQWQKPLLSDQSIDTYFTSTGFDMVTEPGNIFPTPDAVEVSTTSQLADDSPMIQIAHDEVYYVTDQNPTELLKFNGTTFTQTTNDFGKSGVPVRDLCYDAANSTVYALFNDGDVHYLTLDTGGGAVMTSGIGSYVGACIFMHFGRLMVYDGDALLEIEDPLGTPELVTIYNDQMGPDVLDAAISSASVDQPIQRRMCRLAVSSAEGVWIAKNVEQGGGVETFLTRIDRSNDGTDIGVPMATLSRGTAVLDLTYHLGSLVMSASSDLVAVYGNDVSSFGYPQIDMYHLTNDSLGTIGTPNGGLAPDDAPYFFLGARKGNLYFAGTSSIWIYDAVRGGFHRRLEEDYGAAAGGAFRTIAFTMDSDGDPVEQYTHWGKDTVIQLDTGDEGGGTGPHTIESNYIDGNLPSELKSLVGITLMTDGIETGETWTVTIEADDGTFASAAAFTTVGAKTTYKALVTPITGYRFRYKLAWTATGDIASPSRVKGIVLHMVQGEMEIAWQLTLDLNEVRSVENTVLRPEDAVSNLETLMEKQTLTTYVDEMRITSSSHDVRVDSVQISKDATTEGEAVVVLTEQDLDN